MLGATWMHNHDIIFNMEQSKIGFIKAKCSEETDFRNYDDKK